MPERVQHVSASSTDPDVIYVGPGSKWDNPHHADDVLRIPMGMDRKGKMEFTESTMGVANAYTLFRTMMFHHQDEDQDGYPDMPELVAELAGKNLACTCALMDENGKAVLCHADILLDFANRIHI